MKLTSEEVNSIALESRLILTENELDRTVDRFKELDLKNVEPFSFAEVLQCPLREDKIIPFADTEAILNESEHVDGSYFKVPRIMED